MSPLFLDIYENPKRKKTLKPSCPEHPKMIEIKNDKICFHTFLWCFKKVLWQLEDLHKTFLRHQKRSEKIKICHFPPYLGLRWQWLLRLFFFFCGNPNLYYFRFLNSRETKQNLKNRNKTSLLANYSNLFPTPNFRILSMII